VVAQLKTAPYRVWVGSLDACRMRAWLPESQEFGNSLIDWGWIGAWSGKRAAHRRSRSARRP